MLSAINQLIIRKRHAITLEIRDSQLLGVPSWWQLNWITNLFIRVSFVFYSHISKTFMSRRIELTQCRRLVENIRPFEKPRSSWQVALIHFLRIVLNHWQLSKSLKPCAIFLIFYFSFGFSYRVKRFPLYNESCWCVQNGWLHRFSSK